ncbi:Eukaryotic translation initiation factor 3 subunit G [Vitis vinifera]|uniref:Eukaryotic translation initiation factor 3 subunit G n=1 Tax=Vitis vinifera TaxID=29760 RepID=A0A438C846_VITVI|nr:Eukaryotic translation initiation factor 3 subunit G [Vitis vinifera]
MGRAGGGRHRGPRFPPPSSPSNWPDDNGIKKVIEYKFNDDGDKVKITTTTRVRKLANARLSKRAVERRSWPKFGDAIHEDVGSRLTMVSTEEILIERPRAHGAYPYAICRTHFVAGFIDWHTSNWGHSHRRTIHGKLLVIKPDSFISSRMALLGGSKAEETNTVGGDSLAQLTKGGAVLMVCRTCGKKGDHWTSRCPYKDLAPQPEAFIDKPTASDPTAAASVTKGAYVPPSMRAGADRSSGTDMRRRNEENAVRVSNLSEDTHEADLRELFSRFGQLTRVYVAIDHKTGLSRGFGYVNFVNREDAERAISKLNGYGYDSLILQVEWSTPRPN